MPFSINNNINFMNLKCVAIVHAHECVACNILVIEV